jgi:hypothetical protein
VTLNDPDAAALGAAVAAILSTAHSK